MRDLGVFSGDTLLLLACHAALTVTVKAVMGDAMRIVLAALALMAAVLVPVWSAAQAAPVTGNATYFDALGSPYGGCGLPQAELDSQHFVALNVLNTPGDYSSYTRPIPPSQASKIGAFDNGRNCGRYVRVAIGD